jgi:hypothetical protein
MTEQIDTGDAVRHGPSGEKWLVAYVKGDRLAACGWPFSEVPLADCELVRKESPEGRASLLRAMAASNHSDPRTVYARERLAREGVLDIRQRIVVSFDIPQQRRISRAASRLETYATVGSQKIPTRERLDKMKKGTNPE